MTAVAVDLAAVARARAELAALVVAHPSLTSPEAHARLAAALPDLVEPSMPPRLDPESADTTIVGVRMTDEMLRALDAEVARQRAANPDVSIGRSNVLRGIVRRALLNPSPSTVEAAPVPAEAAQVRRPTMPPRRASVRPTMPEAAALPSVPPPPRVPAELVDDAPPASPQLALIPEPPHAPTLSASKVRARLVAINATGVGVRAIGEAAGVSKSSVHNFLRGGDLTPDALDALARYVETHTKGSE